MDDYPTIGLFGDGLVQESDRDVLMSSPDLEELEKLEEIQVDEHGFLIQVDPAPHLTVTVMEVENLCSRGLGEHQQHIYHVMSGRLGKLNLDIKIKGKLLASNEETHY